MTKRLPTSLAFAPTGKVLINAELLYGKRSPQSLLRQAQLDGHEAFVGVEMDAASGGLLKALEDATAEAAAKATHAVRNSSEKPPPVRARSERPPRKR